MLTVTQAKADLSGLVKSAERGSTTTITVNGRPAARIVPADAPAPADAGGPWTLVTSNASNYLPWPLTPAGFVDKHRGGSPEDAQRSLIEEGKVAGGFETLLKAWARSDDRGREFAAQWLNLNTGASIIAVPSGDYWRGSGSYRYFFTLGEGRQILELEEWSAGLLTWHDSSAAFHAAYAQAVELGNRRLSA
ncbi:Prevent-host-death family protein OS=Tsukamurella paurometabola (strain ATCC 8368 / DSM / CCUG 35730 / CIP 100753 / JCM 10117 / KCTC 9821 / NBRC 16120 /NCIMB 702349 / NCTC 13040) OX=521096 GN=Tpau_0248 PE=3 SV=1 [Tsukamurella paurometabola]|uniref:Prevent-host-death family protein n=2 Tax=Tsukamurella paurometabola TaxID=2061 RepID=D5UQR5_TSUPD|nr:prevent-host-death family protein [Tsukamurella paurometabola DSM 20162]SUP42130.1 Antitoxin of toxin-antitoxin stability system [Tsukamurella paurometabola]